MPPGHPGVPGMSRREEASVKTEDNLERRSLGGCPGNASGSSRESWRRCLGTGKVLNAFGSPHQPAGMPVNLAMCLNINQLLSMSPLKPTKPHCQPADGPTRASLPSPHCSSSSLYPLPSSLRSPLPRVRRSCFRKDGTSQNKKHVVFADAKGLALTAVHLFIPESTSSPAKLHSQQSNAQRRHKLKLGFPQPALDFKAFFARLRETNVLLQSCSVSENTLIAKVCVSHVSIEKDVHARVTYNSWRSHHDIPCTFLQHVPYGGSDIDVFAFGLILPKDLDPKEGIEFCLCFRPGPGEMPRWDDNRGQNYRLCMEGAGMNAGEGTSKHYHPKPSYLQPPSWTHPTFQNSTKLQYLQRTLPMKVRAEWNSRGFSLNRTGKCQ
ncbi:protein phosphatase 1 regulatory subunit 3C-B-like [Brachionichthys hirsutus]|uniref:protein phosphatase 1 regulatory subunit 3C-B-like n=1 Tax=Brachionichthys hirsutus TaxID=412623 RepID=UPI003604F61D